MLMQKDLLMLLGKGDWFFLFPFLPFLLKVICHLYSFSPSLSKAIMHINQAKWFHNVTFPSERAQNVHVFV